MIYMPFGKYRGYLISDVPTSYLKWRCFIDLSPDLAAAVAAAIWYFGAQSVVEKSLMVVRAGTSAMATVIGYLIVTAGSMGISFARWGPCH